MKSLLLRIYCSDTSLCSIGSLLEKGIYWLPTVHIQLLKNSLSQVFLGIGKAWHDKQKLLERQKDDVAEFERWQAPRGHQLYKNDHAS